IHGGDIVNVGTMSGSNDLVGDGTGVGTAFNNSQKGDPKLGPLQDNGGPTQTQTVLPGRPALDQGSNPQNPSTNQRRPGLVRTFGASTDIGAFEFQAPPPCVSVAFGPQGEVAEVVRADGTLIQFDAFGAHVLGGGVRSASVAFGPFGEMLLITFQSGTLTQF